jgi:hypothetical protein
MQQRSHHQLRRCTGLLCPVGALQRVLKLIDAFTAVPLRAVRLEQTGDFFNFKGHGRALRF